MVNTAYLVTVALQNAGIPIISVVIGDPNSRATWRVTFDPTATQAQQTTAATILATVAVDAAAQDAQNTIDIQQFIDTMPVFYKAIVLTLLDQINVVRAALVPPKLAITPAQALATVRAKAGTL